MDSFVLRGLGGLGGLAVLATAGGADATEERRRAVAAPA